MRTQRTEEHFLPLDGFELRYRWTQPTHNVLPPEALQTIRPVTRTKSEALARYTAGFCEPNTRMRELSPVRFGTIAHIDTYNNDEERVREWLRTLIPETDTPIVVVWDNLTAVQTMSRVFVQYWDNFCYPSSDDIVVWPFLEDWALTYWHEEWLSVGRSYDGATR